MWNVILWFVIGGLVGWLAWRWIRAGTPGMVADIIAGAVGAMIANVTLSLLIPGYFSFTQMNIPAFFVAFGAAVVLVVIVRAAAGIFHAARA